MAYVKFSIFIIDHDTIRVYEHTIVYKRFKYFVNETFKGGWCIANAKGNDQELTIQSISEKNIFRIMLLLNVNLMIS